MRETKKNLYYIENKKYFEFETKNKRKNTNKPTESIENDLLEKYAKLRLMKFTRKNENIKNMKLKYSVAREKVTYRCARNSYCC
jgi:hypothetical protein